LGRIWDDPSLNTALHVIDDRPSPSFLWSRGLGYLLKEEPIKQPSVVAKLQELSKGKDSTTGHWEIAGLVMTTPFPTYPHGFPPEVMEEFERRIGTKTLGNFPASGNIGIYDNFMELGGHSLLANRLTLRINDTFGIKLSLMEVLTSGLTVADMVKLIENKFLEETDNKDLEAILEEVERTVG